MNALIPKVYPLLLDAVYVGTQTGYRRAFKHNDSPPEEWIIEKITDSVMAEIFERFEIPEKVIDTDTDLRNTDPA